MVTGSFASAVHGVPRATHDIDVVIAPTERQLIALLREFPGSEYYAEIEDALQALRYGSQFNVIDQNSVWKIDFIVRKNRPFSKAEFDRRRRVNILGVSVYAATPEDLLIAKLEWAKMGESERQIRDAAGIIQIQGPLLDIAYVEGWVAELGLQRQWEMARAEAG
jgi:hypothetical protein